MPGTSELPTNTYASAAETGIRNAGQDSVQAQSAATLALAYEQRTVALVEAAKLLDAKGKTVSSNKFLNEALKRLTTVQPNHDAGE